MYSTGKRIVWLDGIKGLACMGVFLHHFTLAFFPATYFGDVNIAKLKNGLDAELAQSPFGFFYNGNYMVALFCLISALVLSLKVMGMKDKDELGNIFVKRYLRLMLPIAPVIFVVYFMLRYQCFSNLDVTSITQSQWLGWYYLEQVDFSRCIESLLFTTWFSADSTFSNAFWMLGYLLLGSFLAVVLSTFAWKMKRNALGIVYCVCVALYTRENTLSLAFVAGVLLAYCYREWKEMFGHSRIGGICLVAGVVLGGYPSGTTPTNLYQYMNCLPPEILPYQFWHIMGAFLTVYGIWNMAELQHLLEGKIVQTLGKISYSIYIVHIPFIFSVSCYILKVLIESGVDYLLGVWIVFFTSLFGVLILAYVYNRYIESGCSILINKILNVCQRIDYEKMNKES